MTALAAAQRRMHAALIHPHADPAAAQGLFQSGGRLDPGAGLAIYQRGYLMRLAACMREQFPALCHALGRALFDDFVADYVRACPPERHTLYDLGRRFPDWLEANRPDGHAREDWVDFMIDLARFEYDVFTMFDVAGSEGSPSATAETPDDALRLQPAFTLRASRFSVAGFYHAVRRGEAPSLPVPAPYPSYVALVRTEYITRTVPLSALQYGLLAALQNHGSFDSALEILSARLKVNPDQIRRLWCGPAGCREQWIAWGLFGDARDPHTASRPPNSLLRLTHLDEDLWLLLDRGLSQPR